ncbi:MAG: aromatic ring-hydroxylating dioxygenase subunit alpha [Actinomycetota bacterium]|nr:aromatic ring-hydroxylating dioxygenase subunit alpha [Actinomycetota bacterium]
MLGATLPWSWYTDADVLALERERIFRTAWQYAGHLGQLAEPGSYLTFQAGPVPLVVVRDRSGSLNAFVNVCRHRGHPVARGAGRRATLQCAYHAWTYGLDGRLRAAPRSDREPGFDPEGLSLLPARVESWGPFVFVNADADAAPLADTLRDLPEIVAGGGVDVDALEFRVRAESTVDANWKIVCENFLECYHCSVAHPGFSAMIDVAPDAYRLETGATFSSQFGPLRENGRQAYDPRGEVERGQFHFLWPNTGINVFPGRPNLSIGPIVPLEPGRTARFLDYFFAPDAGDEWVEELLAFDDQVGREDRALVEGVQRGVASGAIGAGRLLEDAERLIVDFQRRVAGALEDALA